ncbi:MAG: hypothetical protein RBS19_03250 [Bacteroidales bacterium]|nr:hypothetical protein [Bacteroidales bacterium]MDY0215954.1 hypothetical protein [Bacteroidales bacterium]
MKTKLIFSVIFSLLIAMVSGVLISAAVGAPEAAIPLVSILFAASFIPMPVGASMATVYREVWEKEVIKAFTSGIKDSFLDGIPDKSQYVTGDDEVQVINATFFGVEPDVLINNTTYPIPMQELNGENVPIVLDKYQTKVTPVSDDELHALSYDKMGEVKNSHGNALVKNRLRKAIHALAPASNSAKTPVIKTTGSVTPDGTRRRLRWADIVTLREKFSAAEIEVDGMRLVLCPDHVNDLILEDKDLFKTLTNWKTGVVDSQLGFEIRSYVRNPYFKVSTLEKLSFGGTATSDFRMASVVFTPSLARKATGKTKMYYSDATTDPEYQVSKVSFRNYFVALPSISQAIGAIVSDFPGEAVQSVTVAPETMEFVTAGESKVAAVTATGAFSIAVTGEGFSATKSGNAVTVVAAINAGAQRTGTLTITVDADVSKKATIALTQLTGL